MSGKSRVIMEMSGDEAKLLRSYRNAIRENQKLKDEMRDLARTGRNTSGSFGKFGDDIKRAFSPQAVLALAGAITGVGGVVAGLQKVVQVAGEAREDIKAIAEELVESYDAARNLWQISQGKKGYAEMRRDQRLVMDEEGLGREEAGQLLFNLQSLSQGEHLDTIAKAGRFMDPFTASKYFTTIDSPLNYGKDDNSPEQILSGLIAGAGESKFNTAETADWMLRVAPIMVDLKTTQAELLALGASMSEGAFAPEHLATFLRAGHSNLNQWQQGAIANAQGEGAPAPIAPEAPEKPVYEEPKFRGAVTPARLEAYQYRIEDEKERHAERMEDYNKDLEKHRGERAKYEKDLAAWEKAEADRKRIGAAAAGAVGLVQTFQAMRESDPEAYQDARNRNVRFNNFASLAEKGLPEAQALTPVIQAEIDKGQLYQQKVDERPRHLEEQHQLRVAAAQASTAREGIAEAENRLKIIISQHEAIAGLTGGSLTVAKGYEKLLEKGATLVGADAATEEATERAYDLIARRRPETYKKHLDEFAPVDYTTTSSGRMVPESINIDFDQITPAISNALAGAILEMSTGRVDRDYKADIEAAEVAVDMTKPGDRMAIRPVEVIPEQITPAASNAMAGATPKASTAVVDRDHEADAAAAGPATPTTPAAVDMTETNDELAGLGGKLDELIEVTRAGQAGAQGELPTTPEPGGHGY